MSDEPPMGVALPDWRPPPAPPRAPLIGRYCTLEPVSAAAHGEELGVALTEDVETWRYLTTGPFTRAEDIPPFLEGLEAREDVFFAIRDAKTGRAGGLISFLRIDAPNGVIEVGHLCFPPAIQRSRIGSEAVMRMIGWAFDHGYRRVEWKCNALNAASCKAAERYGFTFEGVFRNSGVVKGRNRDTAWYAIIDADWPRIRAAYDAWLDPANFDADGRQREALNARGQP